MPPVLSYPPASYPCLPFLPPLFHYTKVDKTKSKNAGQDSCVPSDEIRLAIFLWQRNPLNKSSNAGMHPTAICLIHTNSICYCKALLRYNAYTERGE
jgi:hypothetical protein